MPSREPPGRLPPLPEQLTEEFYAWELRGRGWQLWDLPVQLEPPFVPFVRGRALPRVPFDDGYRPPFGFLGRMVVDLLRGDQGQREELSDNDVLEDLPVEARELGPLVEVRVVVPKDFSAGVDAVGRFLATPGRGTYALELVGTTDEIVLQFVVADSEAQELIQKLKIHFPGAVLSLGDETLSRAWSEPGEALVVDFGLSQEFVRPLTVFRRFDPDPFAGIVAILSGLRQKEVGVLQVLFERARSPWAGHALEAVQDGSGHCFFMDAPEMLPLAREKLSQVLFATVVRLGTKSGSPQRSFDLVQSLASGLSVLERPDSNWLIPLANDDYPDPLHELDLLERASHRSGMLLSLGELAGLVHLPAPSLVAEKLLRRTRKTRAAPESVRGGELILGMNAHEGEEHEVALSADQRSRHVYVVGASGTGKSTLLLRLILQDIEAGRGVGILDPHGDLVDQVMGRIPRTRLDDVVVFDPSDAEYPVGFNVLSAHSELERTLLSSDLVAGFRRLSTSWGDQMNAVLANAILAFLESSEGGTLADLRRFLIEPEFRRRFLSTVRDPEIVYYWTKEFPLLSGKPQGPILTRLNQFLRPRLIRNMVGQKENRLDFASIMNEQKIFLGRLSLGAIGEENAYLLGGFLVAKFQQTALSRQELAETARRPFYLYMDEFHNFITPSVAGILSGARKYRLSLTLAHQDLRQLSVRDPEILPSVLTNPYTRICFRVGDQDSKSLADGFASFDRADLQSLGTGQAIVRVERADYDFTLDTAPLPAIDEEEGAHRHQEVLEASRAKYAVSRNQVEALLHAVTDPDLEARGAAPSGPPPPKPRVAAPPPPSETTARPQPVEAPTPTGSLPAQETPSGRGGTQHRYLQELVKRWAEAHDWRATLEEQVLDGLGNVDVALRKGERSVACEISVSTDPAHEVDNVQKCLAAGFERVILVGVRKGLLRKAEKGLEALPETERQRVLLATPEELFEILQAVEEETAVREETVKGYRVKVSYRPTSGAEQQAKRQAVSQVVAKALKRLKE